VQNSLLSFQTFAGPDQHKAKPKSALMPACQGEPGSVCEISKVLSPVFTAVEVFTEMSITFHVFKVMSMLCFLLNPS